MDWRFVAIGDRIRIGRRVYVCVERPMVTPANACRGCDLASYDCVRFACSKPDRRDGMFVWFVMEEGERWKKRTY